MKLLALEIHSGTYFRRSEKFIGSHDQTPAPRKRLLGASEAGEFVNLTFSEYSGEGGADPELHTP